MVQRVADAHVAQHGVRADLALVADRGVAHEVRAGQQRRVLADCDARVDINRLRTHERDAVRHERGADAVAHRAVGDGEFGAGVDLLRLGRVGQALSVHTTARGDRGADGVGEIDLAARRGRQRIEHTPQPGRPRRCRRRR